MSIATVWILALDPWMLRRTASTRSGSLPSPTKTMNDFQFRRCHVPTAWSWLLSTAIWRCPSVRLGIVSAQVTLLDILDDVPIDAEVWSSRMVTFGEIEADPSRPWRRPPRIGKGDLHLADHTTGRQATRDRETRLVVMATTSVELELCGSATG